MFWKTRNAAAICSLPTCFTVGFVDNKRETETIILRLENDVAVVVNKILISVKQYEDTENMVRQGKIIISWFSPGACSAGVISHPHPDRSTS